MRDQVSGLSAAPKQRPLVRLIKTLYFQVLVAIVVAVALGIRSPALAISMKPFGDAFIGLLRLMLAPIIFCSVVTGLAQVRSKGQLGRLTVRSLIYFEGATTAAMLLGFAAVNIFKPGAGLHAAALKTSEAVLQASASGGQFTVTGYLLGIIPKSMVGAFVDGSILQVLFVSILVGAVLGRHRDRAQTILTVIEEGQELLARLMGLLMRFAPLGAFGAMAFTVGTYGGSTLVHLGKLILVFYGACAFFVLVGLYAVTLLAGLPFFKLAKLVRDEAVILLGTASAEAILPRLIVKFEQAGCDRAVVGFVVPSAYSFNLDGTILYMALGVGFIAQATDSPLGLIDQLAILAVMMLTSKGGTMMAGGAFVKLAGTIQSTRVLPLNALSLLFGIDRFMATGIALTNLYSNTVATFVIAKWESAFDRAKFDAYVSGDQTSEGASAE